MFCDDLSFDAEDTSYKSLKTMLEGGIEGRPDNVILYATSNRRHLMARDMVENERSTAINPGEAVEEKVSLSDRFGLWLGFHRCSQDEYLAMVDSYIAHYRVPMPARSCGARRWNGQPPAARAPAVWRGNMFRTLPDDLAFLTKMSGTPARVPTTSRCSTTPPTAWIDRRRALADFEVQLRRGDVAGLAGLCDHLAAF